MIRSYLRDIINYRKIQGEWKVHSGNEAIDYKSQREWKIQLTMIINFISSKVSFVHAFHITRIMRTMSNNTETMMGNETDEIIEEHFESLAKISRKD